MSDALDEQIRAYETLLPSIKSTYGSAWVLIANRQVVRSFSSFSAAARYAQEQFGGSAVLIRHTDERQYESVPFVNVPDDR